MSIHLDKRNKTWYIKYHNKTKRGFVSKKEAKQYETMLKAGSLQPQSKIQKYRFSFIADDFIQSKENDLEYSSLILYKGIINDFVKPFFEEYYINDISEIDCKNFRENIYKLDCSAKRKNKILQLTKNIFQYACDCYGLTSNSSFVIKPFNSKKEEKLNKKRKEYSIWDYDEFKHFINCVNDETYKSFFITLYSTGLRLGEALALTFDDLKPDYLSITKSHTKITKEGAYSIKAPKNISSIRDVSINHSLYLYLLSIKQKEMKRKNYSSSWFIFGCEKPLSRTSIERAKNKAIKMAHVRKIRLHDFRHSHASNLIGEGMDIVAVSRRLGHSNIEMTLNTYTHLLKKNDEKITDYLEKSSQNLLNFE